MKTRNIKVEITINVCSVLSCIGIISDAETPRLSFMVVIVLFISVFNLE